MEMHLQPLATTCFVSGETFVEGARVASHLVRSGATLEIVRYDVLEQHAATFAPEGFVACRWVHPFKARAAGENPDRALKLTAESLFVALADPTTEPTPENTRLVQFLALMLERKRVLKPRGRSSDGLRNRYEHAKSKAIFEVPAGDLTPEFFVAVQQQLSVLVGEPKAKVAATAAAASAPAEKPAAAADAAPAPTADVAPAPTADPAPIAGTEAVSVPPVGNLPAAAGETPAPDSVGTQGDDAIAAESETGEQASEIRVSTS
jgi:hypothetical protein